MQLVINRQSCLEALVLALISSPHGPLVRERLCMHMHVFLGECPMPRACVCVCVGGGGIAAGLSPAAGVNGIYCYDTQKTRWWGVEGNTTHKSGGIAAVGNTLMLGGGFDPASTVFAPTDVVDVYDFQVMFPTSS